MNAMDLTNRTALITGAAGGLGMALAEEFFSNGYSLALNYRSSAATANAMAEKMSNRAVALKADVSIAPEADAMAKAAADFLGSIRMVAANAAITQDALMIKQKEADWDRIMDINLKGVFNTVRACVPHMKHGGHIVIISSYSGLKGKAGQSAYGASKAALLGFMKTAAIELADKGIRVNAVLPGYMDTEMGRRNSGAMDAAKADSLLHTLSSAQEAARFVYTIATTSCITGQTFCLDSRIV
ncbi:MAG: SDR family NAD(P)-dependent oxidoreductase [Nitrospiraceae bacterium]|nr:SDR family NAD(P)-dependent oxidoreductase [Nitrospiraceae bacterium]